MIKYFFKKNYFFIFISFLLILSFKQSQAFNETEAFKYCLHKITHGIKKTLKDGTTWGTGTLIYFADEYSFQIFKTQSATIIGGIIGSIIKHSCPKDVYRQLNTTLTGSIFKTAIDCPFATVYLLATWLFYNVKDTRENYIASFLVASYLGWNFFDNYILSDKQSKLVNEENETQKLKVIKKDLLAAD